MPSGPRIRDNNVFGLTTDNPLTAGAGTFNSLGLAKMSIVASAHALVTLDPIRQYGEPEIVVVTAHASLASVATITRGQYNTTARSHPLGTLWVHQPINEDFIAIVTAATHSANPYEGQVSYETDTDSFKAYNGTTLEQFLTIGPWTSYTPTYTNLTVGAGSNTGGFIKVGRTVHFYVRWIFGAGAAVGTNPTYSLPVQASTRYSSTTLDAFGTVIILDSGTADFGGTSLFATSTSGALQVWNSAGTYLTANSVTATVPMTWTTSDGFVVFGTYESAI